MPGTNGIGTESDKVEESVRVSTVEMDLPSVMRQARWLLLQVGRGFSSGNNEEGTVCLLDISFFFHFRICARHGMLHNSKSVDVTASD